MSGFTSGWTLWKGTSSILLYSWVHWRQMPANLSRNLGLSKYQGLNLERSPFRQKRKILGSKSNITKRNVRKCCYYLRGKTPIFCFIAIPLGYDYSPFFPPKEWWRRCNTCENRLARSTLAFPKRVRHATRKPVCCSPDSSWAKRATACSLLFFHQIR